MARIPSTSFFIELNVKTGSDFQTFGKFFLGSDRRFANSIFGKLVGSKRIGRDTILNMELVEAKDELPQNIQMISCTLEQLTENCKMITRETFKFLNMAET